jgi:hypothetical protein
MPEQPPQQPAPRRPLSRGVIAVRYVIPTALILAGFICLAVAPSSSAVEGWALFTGAGLSVLLLNQLHRIGVIGDSERDREEAARSYFHEHGHWPDESPGGSGNGHHAERAWSLPEGIATPESEAAERERRSRGEPPPDA